MSEVNPTTASADQLLQQLKGMENQYNPSTTGGNLFQIIPNPPQPCPSCGRCPTCGRGGYSGGWWGIYPQPYITYTTGTVSK